MTAPKQGDSLLSDVPTPDYLSADDGDWHYYVAGHDTDELWVIDDPGTLEHECLWMRPQRVSAADPDERGEGWDALTRDKNGRFQAAYCWYECGENAPDARPFIGARYKP